MSGTQGELNIDLLTTDTTINFPNANGSTHLGSLGVSVLTSPRNWDLPDASGTIALTGSYTLENVLANGDFTGANDIVMSTQTGDRLIKSDNTTSSNKVSLKFLNGGASQDSILLGDPTSVLGGTIDLRETTAVFSTLDGTGQYARIIIDSSSSTIGINSTAGNYNFDIDNEITLRLQSPNGTANWATLKPTNLTANRTYTFQNASGTVAFLSDVQSNDELSEVLANGNITGGTNISMSNGDIIQAASGNSELNLRDSSDDIFLLSNDNTRNTAWFLGHPTTTQAGFGLNNIFYADVDTVMLDKAGGSSFTFLNSNNIGITNTSNLAVTVSPIIIGDSTSGISYAGASTNKAVYINTSGTIAFNSGIDHSVVIAAAGGAVKTNNVLYTTNIGFIKGSDAFEGILSRFSLTGDQTWTFLDETGIIPVGPDWNTLIANPTMMEDAYVIAWDNGTGEYILTPGASGTGTVTSIDVSGGTTGLTTSGGPVTTTGTITLSGTLAESNGGTGQTTYAVGDILYSAGLGSLSRLSAGTDTHVLTLSGGVPTWTAPVTGGIYGGSGALSSSTVITMATNNLTFDTTSGDILFTNATGPNPLLLIDGASGSIGIGGSVTLTESLSVYNQTSSGNDTALGIHNDSVTGTQNGLLIQVDGISSNNIALTIEADNAASNNYALIVPPNKGDTGFGTITPDATVDIVGTLQYSDGSEGAGKILQSDASGNATWTTQTTAKKTWSWGASRNSANATLSYIRTFDGTPTNIAPYVVPFNCNITDITCSTSVNETWTAEVHVNGVAAGSISVTAASSDVSTGLSIAVAAGDLISFYCNGTNISHPHIDAWFIET
jgi:hypothetical protein